jgi:hypothetical protein
LQMIGHMNEPPLHVGDRSSARTAAADIRDPTARQGTELRIGCCMSSEQPHRTTTAMTHRVLSTLLVMLCGALSGCRNNPTPLSPAGPSITAPPQVITAPQPATPLVSVLADATLSGKVYEVAGDSPGQTVGIEGVSVYCEQCGELTHSWAYTDSTGNYTFPHGVWTEGRPLFLFGSGLLRTATKIPPAAENDAAESVWPRLARSRHQRDARF